MNAFAGASSSEDTDSDRDDFLHPSTNPDEDDFADFNPRKRRRTGRDAKESAALGIFGSESEDEGPGKRWKKKNIRAQGMSFVTAGQKAVDEDEDDEEDDVDEEDTRTRLGLGLYSKNTAIEEEEDEEEEKPERPRLGMGLDVQNSTGGLGLQNPAVRRLGGGLGAGSSPLGKGFVPSSESVPILRDDLEDERFSTPRIARPSAFSTPTTSRSGREGSAKKPAGINTGSFAARMMAKMGYKEGQGLGKEGQGRSGVIEVQLRPQGVGLGAVREKSQQEKAEERRQASLRGEVLEDSDEEKKRRKKAAKVKTSGTDSGASTPKRRPKPKYQSLPEIQRAAPGLKIPEAFTPILDMTGPGHKLLTSSSGLLTPTAGAEVTETTEQIEARKLARRAQNDLGAFVEEWKNLEERKAWVEMEILQQQQLIDEQQSLSEQWGSAANVVQSISESVKDSQWDPVISALMKVEDLNVTGNDELSSIAVSAVYPFFRQAVEGWQPLEDPKLSGVAADGFAPALHGIKHLLGMSPQASNGSSLALRDGISATNGHTSRAHRTTPFESLMYTVWFPKVRSAITNAWDVYDPTPVQTFIDSWEELLPPFIRSEMLNQLVVRKLDEAVGHWNPKKRGKHASPLPHLWLFPWLQYLPAHHADPKSSTGLVSDVKRKFRHLIDGWDFKRGVVPGLDHWRDVLKPKGGSDQWTPLMVNHVLPNLARYLRTNFKVAPQDQEPYMQCLEKTLEWESILGTRIMSQLLVDELFPMWIGVLHTWLTLEGVSYEEVAGWVEFWRGLIPESLSSTSAIKAEWKRGEDLINTALDLGSSARTTLPEPSHQLKSKPTFQEAKPAEPLPIPQAEEISFRHRVEDFCMENNLLFLPQKSTLDAHGPVYRVTASGAGKGGVLLYFRSDQVYAQVTKGSWTALGSNEDALDTLLELGHQQ